MKDFDITKRRSQEVVLVLYVLRELGGSRTKQEVLRFIRENRFYALEPEDTESFDGQNEWKSDTLLCWARKDAVMEDLGWMFRHDEKDSWDINRPGLEALEKIFHHLQTKNWKIHQCYMWRPEFKKIADPSYEQSTNDWSRAMGQRHAKALALLEDLGL